MILFGGWAHPPKHLDARCLTHCFNWFVSMQSLSLSASTTGATRNGALRSFGSQPGKFWQTKTTRRMVSTTNDAPTAGSELEVVAPAVLEGTDETFGERFSACGRSTGRQDFEPPTLTPTLLHAAGDDLLIARAKEVFETMTGVKDDSVLAPDFRFEFPVVRVDLGRRAVNSPDALTRDTRYVRSPGVARQGQVPRRRSGVLPELGHPEHELERMV